MKVLKVLLALLTTLAVALTAALLLIQDKNAPRYIQIYENEQYHPSCTKASPSLSGTCRPGRGFCVLRGKRAAKSPGTRRGSPCAGVLRRSAFS